MTANRLAERIIDALRRMPPYDQGRTSPMKRAIVAEIELALHESHGLITMVIPSEPAGEPP
jgi:hypothetical protein